jgi:hypothetical protein
MDEPPRLDAAGHSRHACLRLARRSQQRRRMQDVIVIEAEYPRDDEKTQKMAALPNGELSPDQKLIIGYLTMEEHQLFAPLSIDEQELAARNLRR